MDIFIGWLKNAFTFINKRLRFKMINKHLFYIQEVWQTSLYHKHNPMKNKEENNQSGDSDQYHVLILAAFSLAPLWESPA